MHRIRFRTFLVHFRACLTSSAAYARNCVPLLCPPPLPPSSPAAAALQVSWYERRSEVPPAMAAHMDAREIVELSEQTDVNQVHSSWHVFCP